MKSKLTLLSLLLLSGCVQVPTSRIQFGGAKAFLPKDLTADSIEITLQSGTNKMTFIAKKINTKNNPQVIDASTAQLDTVIHATGDVAGSVLGAAVKAMAK